MITNARHVEHLEKAKTYLEKARQASSFDQSEEALSMDIKARLKRMRRDNG